MDPQLEKTPGLALPNPASEQGSSGVIAPEANYKYAEQTSPGAMLPPAMPPVIDTPVASVPSQPAADPVAAVSSGTSDDNADSLDEEWINKAKAIVEQTRHDPRLESLEISKVKADYLRIRYNKHIKVAEESSK